MHILIVEDDTGFAMLFERVVQPILQRFPHSIATVVSTIEDGKTIWEKIPPPDVVILDLSLPDSTIEMTLSRLDEIEERSALIIVTGLSRERVESILEGRQVEMLEKEHFMKSPSFLNYLILKVVKAFKGSEVERLSEGMEELKRMLSHGRPKTN